MSESAILLVDDEKSILDCLQEQLERAFGRRFVYEKAESVDEAWEVIEDLQGSGVQIAAVVSDWLMPGTKGDEFLIDLGSSNPQTARVLLTGQADADAIDRVQKSGAADGVLAKPWAAEDLQDLLVRAIAA